MNDYSPTLQMPRNRRQFVAAVSTLLGLTMFGCSSSDTYHISGEVFLEGNRLESGIISFRPLTSGPTHGADISSGAFEIAQGGMTKGEYIVSIESWRTTGRKVKMGDGEGLVDEQAQFVLPRYNTDSELRAIVDRGSTHFRFDLHE